MPAPLTVSAIAPFAGLGVMVNALAPGLKTMLFTSIEAVIETSVLLETPKVAISFGPFGTVAGVQFAAVFQSPLVGLRFQVALPAWAGAFGISKSNPHKSRADSGSRGEFIGFL